MGATLEVTTHETIFDSADVESSRAGIFDCRRSIFLYQGKHSQDAADACLSLPVVQQLAELASLAACVCSAPQELRRTQRHFLWVIFFLDAISAALLTQMFAKKLVGVGMQDAYMQRVPLHLPGTSDPSWRQAVVGGFHFHATIEMNHAFPELVVAELFERQWQQVRFFFEEHGDNLAFGRAMDTSVGPTLFPAVEIRLRFFQAFKAHPFERCPLGVADARLHFPFAIGILDPARQGCDTVVSQDIAEQRVDRGIVEVRNRYAFFQVVENHDSRATT